MPIRREYRWLYPIDWPQLTDVIRFERAGGRCERCGRPHGVFVAQLADGRWWDAERGYWRTMRGRRARRLPPPDPALFEKTALPVAALEADPGPLFAAPVSPGRRRRRHPDVLKAGVRLVRIALSTAHLDHDPSNNRAKNLKALCQVCHLQHDRAEHQRRRQETLKARKAIGDLFQGPYGYFS